MTNLIDKVLAVVIAKLLSSYNSMEICLHEFLNQVDLIEFSETWWFKEIEDSDDVLVMEVTEELDFAQSS